MTISDAGILDSASQNALKFSNSKSSGMSRENTFPDVSVVTVTCMFISLTEDQVEWWKYMKKLFFLSGLFRNDLSIFKNIRKQTVLSVEFRPDPVMRVRIIQISILNSISLLAADIPRQISVLFTDKSLLIVYAFGLWYFWYHEWSSQEIRIYPNKVTSRGWVVV